MTDLPYALSRPSEGALQIQLRGELSEHWLLDFEHALRSRTRGARDGSLAVLVDLSAVEDYSVEARTLLVRALAHLEPRTGRVAYVAAEAGPRALAMWVSRMATPGKSRIVSGAPEALRWLIPERSGVHALQPADFGAAPPAIQATPMAAAGTDTE